MELAARCLAPGGRVFIHTITGIVPRTQIDPWYQKYIFPNAVIPTLGQLATAMDDLLVIEDVHNIGEHYDRTLMAWWNNFERGFIKADVPAVEDLTANFSCDRSLRRWPGPELRPRLPARAMKRTS